jgi:hypothetical protein
MKLNRISILMILAISTSFLTPSSIAATKPKAAGRSSTAVINTILNGKGAPSNTLGINGDFYIDTRSLLISGPKANGKWPVARSLQGANGINGIDGTSVKNVTTTSNIAGPVGPQGEPGQKGLDGVAGKTGATGLSGATGAQGSSGATGPAGSGATGAQGPSGANGTNGTNGGAGGTGLTGARGETGTVGSTGATGAKGETGTVGTIGEIGARGETGTVGPSEVSDVSIPSWTLQTATSFGFATSSGFGLLKAGKSYQFSILLWGTTNCDGAFGLELLTSTGAAPSYFYTVMRYQYAIDPTVTNKYGFSVIGTIVVGVADVSLSIKIVDAVGDTTTKPMVMTGKALVTLVGAVL